MPQKPDDKIKPVSETPDDPDPRIFIIVDGKKRPRPAPETYYAREYRRGDDKTAVSSKTTYLSCSCDPYEGTVCSCFDVCTCYHVRGTTADAAPTCGPVDTTVKHICICQYVLMRDAKVKSICTCDKVASRCVCEDYSIAETATAEFQGDCECNLVGDCKCNRVCKCNPLATTTAKAVTNESCSCEPYSVQNETMVEFEGECECHGVGSCTCNRVCKCNPQCSCEEYSTSEAASTQFEGECECHGVGSCACNRVCKCNPLCSCDTEKPICSCDTEKTYCSCDTQRYCSCDTVQRNYCSCDPQYRTYCKCDLIYY
jgi:hypothetical protein